MALIDKHGEVFQVNRALTRITGYSSAALPKMPLHDLVHPDDLSEVVSSYSSQLLSGELGSYQGEMRWFDANGHIIWVSVYVSVVHGRTGSPTTSSCR